MIEARCNITYDGKNSDIVQSVDFFANDEDIKRWAKEAIESDSVPGMIGVRNVDFTNFIVDRFEQSGNRSALLVVRSKTPFGTLSDM